MAKCCTKRVNIGTRCRGKIPGGEGRVGFIACKKGAKRIKAGTRCMGKVKGHFQFKSC